MALNETQADKLTEEKGELIPLVSSMELAPGQPYAGELGPDDITPEISPFRGANVAGPVTLS